MFSDSYVFEGVLPIPLKEALERLHCILLSSAVLKIIVMRRVQGL